MNTTGNPTTELANGLRSAFAEAALRAPLLAPLFALILTKLDAVLRQLEAIFASWQAGTLSAPQPAACTAASPPPPGAARTRIAVIPLRHPAPAPVAGASRLPAPLSPELFATAATAIARYRAAPNPPPYTRRGADRASSVRIPITARHARAPPAAPWHFRPQSLIRESCVYNITIS